MATRVWILKALVWVAVLLLPISASMEAVCALVVADLFTGIWAAKKRGEQITSWGMRKTVSKILAYELAIVLAYVLEVNFLTLLPAVKTIAGFIAATEFKSALENLSNITGVNLAEAAKGLIQGTKVNEEKRNVADTSKTLDPVQRGPTPPSV